MCRREVLGLVDHNVGVAPLSEAGHLKPSSGRGDLAPGPHVAFGQPRLEPFYQRPDVVPVLTSKGTAASGASGLEVARAVFDRLAEDDLTPLIGQEVGRKPWPGHTELEQLLVGVLSEEPGRRGRRALLSVVWGRGQQAGRLRCHRRRRGR